MPLVLGNGVLLLGFLAFTQIGTTAGESEYFSTFFLPTALFGAGLGLSIVPTTTAALASAPAANAGIASGVHNTMSRGGQVLVVGVLGGLAITWFGQLLVNDPYIKSLPQEAQIHLAAATGDLAETSIPESLSEGERAGVHSVIREAFVATYSILMWLGVASCALNMLVALIFIDDMAFKLRRGEDILDDCESALV